MDGSDLMLLVDTSITETPSYKLVACQRGFTYNGQRSEIDVSCKNEDVSRVLGGRLKETITLESLYAPTNDAYLALVGAMEAGTKIKIAEQEVGVTKRKGSAYITSMSKSAPIEGGVTFSASLTIDGAFAL